MLPVSKEKYQKKVKTLLVKRVVKEMSFGDQFGFEEIVILRNQRIFIARAVGPTPSTLLYMSRDKFIEFNTQADVKQLIGLCEMYTDYE
jgi:hypothetical protein